MCGINGVVAFQAAGERFIDCLGQMNQALKSRGPDHDGKWCHGLIGLGHRRLSILDTSAAGNQPMVDPTGRFIIVFNGEFFNFKTYRDRMMAEGRIFNSTSDTEVILALYQEQGVDFVKNINGFFALAIYDSVDNTVFLARDRFGIKPLMLFESEEALLFSSEIKALLEAGIPRKIDAASLQLYLHLNYVPGLNTMLQGVTRMEPGSWMLLKPGDRSFRQSGKYYEMPDSNTPPFEGTFQEASDRLYSLMDESVKLRLVSDVPLGAFLSGGIDSSAVVALASRHVNGLKTFSIGFKDEPLYDETRYAQMVAKKFKTDHTEFILTTDDLFEELHRVLDYLDDPFADSSALAVQILCHRTSKHAKVVLSGDGADEMLGGYNKHRAELIFKTRSLLPYLSRMASPALGFVKGSRGSAWGNLIRKVHRFAEGAKLNPAERYWRWCGYTKSNELDELLHVMSDQSIVSSRKSALLKFLGTGSSMEMVFRSDMGMVLPGDMLVKVDMMSMANALEVRVPFLDYRVVDFAMTLPSQYRINQKQGKLVLRNAFRDVLPRELFERPKHGFEVPLLKWFRSDLKTMILDDLLNDDFIEAQGIFQIEAIRGLKQRIFAQDPGDIESRIWGLIVFQYWWKKYQPSID